MWPNSPFADSRGSFVVPVLPPTVDPDSSPTKSVTLSCAWLPFVRGALKQLLLQSTWDTDDAGLDLVQQRVFNLIDLFTECSGGEPLPFECLGDLTLEAQPFGTWTILESLGSFSPGNGYIDTDAQPANWYRGVRIQITFDNPIIISDAVITYGYTGPHASGAGPDSVWLGLYNLDAGHWIGGGVPFGSMPTAIPYHTGADSAYSANFILYLICDEADLETNFSPTTSCAITRLDIAGSSVTSPCP